jgi:hypothetical protein
MVFAKRTQNSPIRTLIVTLVGESPQHCLASRMLPVRLFRDPGSADGTLLDSYGLVWLITQLAEMLVLTRITSVALPKRADRHVLDH